MPTKPIKIDLLRHGELQTPGLFCAHKNERLSEKGIQQLETATQNAQWDVIISSPYARCRQYAEVLSQSQSCPLRIFNNFKEMDFGRWTGIQQETIWKQDSGLLKQLWSHPEIFIAPDGESIVAFCERVHQGWEELLETYSEHSILLMTHAGVIRCILANALNITYKSTLAFEIGYAKYTRLHGYPDQVYSLVEHGARN